MPILKKKDYAAFTTPVERLEYWLVTFGQNHKGIFVDDLQEVVDTLLELRLELSLLERAVDSLPLSYRQDITDFCAENRPRSVQSDNLPPSIDPLRNLHPPIY